MALRLVQVNFKARDDSALGNFWAAALDWGVGSEGPGVTNVEPRGFVWPDPVAVCIDVVAVPNPETVKYRTHLELASSSTAHYTKLVAHLGKLGATGFEDGQSDDPWTFLADPEGNIFRVLEPQPIYESTGPIAAVVVACSDPREMARFWGGALDWTLFAVTDDHARLRSASSVGPFLEFRRSTGEPAAASRAHLDVMPYPQDDQAAEVARLQILGASEADIGQGDVPWTVLRDTEGNDFCVLAPR